MGTKIFKIELFNYNDHINKIFGDCMFKTRESARRYLRDRICDLIEIEYKKYCKYNYKKFDENYIQDIIHGIKDGKNYKGDKFILSEDMCYIETYDTYYASYHPHKFLINYVYLKD